MKVKLKAFGFMSGYMMVQSLSPQILFAIPISHGSAKMFLQTDPDPRDRHRRVCFEYDRMEACECGCGEIPTYVIRSLE